MGHVADQAEGLRKLLGRDFVRILTMTSSREGVGKTTAVLNLAIALSKAGKNVLVLDENPGKGGIAAMLGIENAHDLADVANFGMSLEEAMISGPEGVAILQAGRRTMFKAYGGMGGSQCNRLVDVVLVDSAVSSESRLLTPDFAAQEVVVVLSAEGQAITDAYAHIKAMHKDYGKRHFRILVNKVKDEAEARAAFDAMSQVARRFLALSLDFMGHVPFDESLRQASRLKGAVVEAFPLAASSSSFRKIADTVVRWPYPQHQHGSIDDILQQLIKNSRLSAANI
jgi:flagellar biosynthesis protein FlhG